ERLTVIASTQTLARPVQLQRRRAACGASEDINRSVQPRFFSPDEFNMVDELSELIIPADEHSPGARAAEVAAYIDRRLAESLEDEPKRLWHSGLALIDSLSEQTYGCRFMKATPEQRVALITMISQNEEAPRRPEERFFKEVKSRTARAYYTSAIGIHQEMEYKGNIYIDEFIGFNAE